MEHGDPGDTNSSSKRSITLSDAELLEHTRRLVGRSNQVLAELLAHLAEVEARGIHRLRACSTLCSYCIYELRMSEDAASRRVAAARLVRRFPQLIDAIEGGELHLTGLLMLGPHLTLENCASVLLQAKHRTKKELEKLVRELDPLPDVPARIEPLGSAPARNGFVPSNPTWRDLTRAMCPVRELRPADRPRDWLEDGWGPWEGGRCDRGQDAAPEGQRYKVQFTATEEYVQLLERAKALLSQRATERLARGDSAASDAIVGRSAREAEVRRPHAHSEVSA